MKQLIRFSVSGLIGFVITAALFIGMLSLLSSKKTQVNTETADIKFSFVKDFQEPVVKPDPKSELPEPQEVTQAPSMTSVAMDPVETPSIDVPDSSVYGKNLNIIKSISIAGNGLSHGHLMQGDPGGIKSAVPPMYPPKELAKKTEGWVKLLIEVNEFGAVSSAKVLQSKPTRAFNAAAIKAVRKWKFHPKLIDGQAVPFQVTQTIEFKLDQ